MTDGLAEAGLPDSALLLAVDPVGLGGAVLRGQPGVPRERFLSRLRALLPDGTPWRRLPHHVTDDRLLGGLDLPATLRAGRPVAATGLLAEADGGVVLLAMAERMETSTAGRLTAVLDSGEVRLQRDGLSLARPARLCLVALDEGMELDERPPDSVCDRLAFRPDLSTLAAAPDEDEIALAAAARARLAGIATPDEALEAICAAAAALGIGSARAPILALRAARAAAALAGRDAIAAEDAALAARLVLGPRATVLPQAAPPPEAEAPETPEPPEPDGDADAGSPDDADQAGQNMGEIVLEAARASLPDGLLAQLGAAGGAARSRASGATGAMQRGAKRGRPIGARRGEPTGGARLDLLATLRAASPWQKLRRAEAERGLRIDIRRDDFRVIRFRQRSRTTTIFVVDASGSAALHRLAEAKGAVELLLGECYIRRDQVALVAFRGRVAELLLPPTSSLVRARRELAGLPGGGGTPLATAIDAATGVADAARRRGDTPLVVFLTDGRGNVARDGSQDRAQAERDALAAARLLAATGTATLLVDTAPRPQPAGRRLAEAMGARYLPLPAADAATLSQAIRRAA